MLFSKQNISEAHFFLKFFERRGKFRFQFQKKLKIVKNKVTRGPPCSIIAKYNGYEIIKHELARKE